MGKARKKPARQYEALLDGEFYGLVDSWTEHLCLARNPDCSTLTSRSHQILAEAYRYEERGWLPETIRGKEVGGVRRRRCRALTLTLMAMALRTKRIGEVADGTAPGGVPRLHRR